MSKTFNICCTVCGISLYDSMTIKEKRIRNYARRVKFYVINDNGNEAELCDNCFKEYVIEKNKEEKMNEFIDSLSINFGH